jgi:3-hydroxyisobutyrate dehydrogenase-like beta-hydroxyacid dehydrogenase
MNIAVVGLGRMGSGMAGRLIGAGAHVIGWDADPAARERGERDGITIAVSPCEAAAFADVVLTSVTEDVGVRGLFAGRDGFLTADVRGTLFIEMSTLQPATVRELQPAIVAGGASIVDAPVLGTIPNVHAGELVALAGGDDADLDRAQPVLAPLTRRVVRMGPLGSGHAMKLVANLGLAAYVQALAEGLALGVQEGLSIDGMLDVLCAAPTTATGWLAAKSGVLRGAPADMTLDIRTMRKDVMSIVATGARNGVPMPLASGTLAALSAAVAAGHGANDLADVPRFFRDDAIQRWPATSAR